MKRGLNLNWAVCTSNISQSLDSLIWPKDDSKYISDAINNNAEQKEKWLNELKKYIRHNEGEIINGDFIEKVWFPEVKSDIFISHSHSDEEIALKIKFLLEKNLILMFLLILLFGEMLMTYCGSSIIIAVKMTETIHITMKSEIILQQLYI